jgi:3-hydroxybutyryl-CoA dehydrogenase
MMTSPSHLGIVGAGLMGTGIAVVFAKAGYNVVLLDTSPDRLAEVDTEVRRVLAELVHHHVITKDASTTVLTKITTAADINQLSHCDFVLEAVPERLELKQRVYAELEEHLTPNAIIASNTSGLMPSALSTAMTHPERFLVAHFWNPPYAVPLVEVVPSERTAPPVIDTTLAMLRQCGQTPVLIRKEIPGFIGNRLQYAVLREALAIVRSGAASPADVDAVMRSSLGRRYATTGPLETADLGGLNTFLGIAEQLMPELAKDEDVLALIRDHVDKGEIGPRSGQGFYTWTPAHLEKVRGTRDADLLRRLAEDVREAGTTDE